LIFKLIGKDKDVEEERYEIKLIQRNCLAHWIFSWTSDLLTMFAFIGGLKAQIKEFVKWKAQNADF